MSGVRCCCPLATAEPHVLWELGTEEIILKGNVGGHSQGCAAFYWHLSAIEATHTQEPAKVEYVELDTEVTFASCISAWPLLTILSFPSIITEQ